MFMQRRSEFQGAIIDIDEHADRKQDAAIRDNAIRIGNERMASRSVMADWEGKTGWVTLRVADRSELDVESDLIDADVMTFMPCINNRVEIRRGRKWIIPRTPILSGYVQVRCALDPRALTGLLTVKHVIEIVGGSAFPWLTTDSEMRKFMALHDDGSLGKMVADMRLKIGDMVRVIAGPWVGRNGKIVQMPRLGKKGQGRMDVVVACSGMGGAVDCTMPLAFVKKV